MNLQDLLKIDENTLRTLIGQVADQVRQSPAKSKHAKLRKSLLDICDTIGIAKREPSPESAS